MCSKGEFNLKEFNICYIYDNDIKREKIITNLDMHKAEILHEVSEKISRYGSFILHGEQGDTLIQTSLVRYIKVSERNVRSI